MLSRCAKDKPSVNYARIVLLFCESMIVWCDTKTYNDYFDAALTLEPTAGKIGKKTIPNLVEDAFLTNAPHSTKQRRMFA